MSFDKLVGLTESTMTPSRRALRCCKPPTRSNPNDSYSQYDTGKNMETTLGDPEDSFDNLVAPKYGEATLKQGDEKSRAQRTGKPAQYNTD